MNATKILWAQILLVSRAGLRLDSDGVDRKWRLGFQPQLGTPWFELFGGTSINARLFLLVVLFRRLCAPHL